MSHEENALQRVFRRSRVFLPVIHPVSRETALASIRTAVQSGADGVFQIDQGMSPNQVLEFIPEVRRLYRSLWIGVNLLGKVPEDVIDLVADLPVGGIRTKHLADRIHEWREGASRRIVRFMDSGEAARRTPARLGRLENPLRVSTDCRDR